MYKCVHMNVCSHGLGRFVWLQCCGAVAATQLPFCILSQLEWIFSITRQLSFFSFFSACFLKMAVFWILLGWSISAMWREVRGVVGWRAFGKKMCTLEVIEENSSILYVTKDYRWAQSLRLNLPLNSIPLSLKFLLLFCCSGFNWVLNRNSWMEVFPLNNWNNILCFFSVVF